MLELQQAIPATSAALACLGIEPVDVLFLRNNQLFGEASHHAAASMPPWPSLFAGALRTRMLADAGVSFADFKACRTSDEVRSVLGKPDAPGSFEVAWVGLWRQGQGTPGGQVLFPAPADLVFLAGEGDRPQAHILRPADLGSRGIAGSFALEQAPVLRAPAGKPLPTRWLPADDLRAHLATPGRLEFSRSGDHRAAGPGVAPAELWQIDPRLGIALQPGPRTAQEAMLYTTEAIALSPGVGFAVAVRGAGALLPDKGLLRLGGDGRGAAIRRLDAAGTVSFPLPSSWERGFRMILATPGIFPYGWQPIAGGKLAYRGLKARLVAAAVGRHEVLSGWDLARQAPKPAYRAVPAGSVFWFEIEQGDPLVLGDLLERGLWPLWGGDPRARELETRRPEGFNRVWFGTF